MTEEKRVSITIEDNIAHVLLDRGDKMNALDPAMFAGIIDAADQLQSVKGVRAVVLSGAGRAFCAGLDLASMAQTGRHRDTPLTERTHGNANMPQHAAMAWRKLPMPVVAAIHGVCFGGGLQIASGADIRVAAPDTRFAIMETKWGLVPDMAGYVLWRGNVREDWLRELTYTHREFDGNEAARVGIASHVDPDPLGRAMAIAREIAAQSPHAVRAAKALSNRIGYMTEDEALMAESIAQTELMGTKNQMESVRAGLEKRAPDFDEA